MVMMGIRCDKLRACDVYAQILNEPLATDAKSRFLGSIHHLALSFQMLARHHSDRDSVYEHLRY